MKNTGNLKVTTPSDFEIQLTRDFDAPRRLVFKALTQPELLKRWFGPPGWSLPVCEIDLRVGGAYRYVMSGPEGMTMGMHGVYREVLPSDRLVNTEIFDDPWYPGESIVTALLIEVDGKTTLTTTILYESQEIRDAVLKTPMEDGVAASYDRLADVLSASIAESSARA